MVSNIVHQYLLLEGKFAPSLYSFEEVGFFHEAKNEKQFLEALPSYSDIDSLNDKILLFKDRVEYVKKLPDKEQSDIFVRYPFTYFDFNCPLCNHLILSYVTEKSDSKCDFTEDPCQQLYWNSLWLRQ